MSHVAAFLVLHEVTAIVPLVAFFAVLHWGAERLPLDEWIGRAGKLGEWVEEGKVRGERFLRRRGWLKEDEKEAMRDERPEIEAGRPDGKGLSEKQVRIIMELAVAYAINKAIMPLRILVSLRLVPPFIALARRLRMIGR